jgi:uncharacterized protein YdhG (YjbR/CyaY superfamily)
MNDDKQVPETIAAYLVGLPEPAREPVTEVVRRVRIAAPGAEESIAYEMPAFRFTNGRNFYVAGWKAHLSLHGVPELPGELEGEVSPWRSGRGTVKFPFRTPVPYDLVEAIVSALAAGAA